MFLRIERIVRRGASDRPEIAVEALSVDIIERIVPVEVLGIDRPCVALHLAGAEPVLCLGGVDEILAAIDGLFDEGFDEDENELEESSHGQ